uniref:B box-type domain-containing protein n=1 Tax=Felis catus TaxID=9685 RepID=A0ABI7XMG8_FELCA
MPSGHTDPVTVPVPLGTLEEMHCEEHGEKVCFFCGHDAQLLCMRCREGPSHHTHAVGFLDGACQPNQDGVRTQLEALRVEGEEIEDIKSREDQKFQMLLTHIEIRKQQVEAVFEKLQQELREQRGLLLARLRGLEVQVCEEREDYISKFSEEVARHRAEAEELEKCQQLASVLLHVGGTGCRCEKTFVSPETISPALVKKIRDVHRKILPLPEMLRTFSESLVHHLETDSGAGTRDPPAASWSTALSEDRKPTRFTRDQQDLPHCPWSSEGVPLALGCPGGTSGRPRGHAVGVAGAWARVGGEERVSPGVYVGTSLEPFQILSCCPRQTGVALDYHGGKVTFTNARTQELIYKFFSSFMGRVFPFLQYRVTRKSLGKRQYGSCSQRE